MEITHYVQTKVEQSEGELYNAKKEMQDENVIEATEKLMWVAEMKHWKETKEVMDLIFKLRANNMTFDEIKRGLNREYNLKKHQEADWTYKGGRPSDIKLYEYHYSLLKKGEESYSFPNIASLLLDAKIKLSRTSFWRLKKRLKITSL